MKILINCSNLSGGGGAQVADSVCSYTNLFPQHHFVVVYPAALKVMGIRVKQYSNVDSVQYDFPQKDFKSLLTGRNAFLDELVASNKVDCVLTVFGPMKWRPRCCHICGFALAQLVIPESPYYQKMSIKQRVKSRALIVLNTIVFQRGTRYLYTENPLISERVKRLIKHSEVRTITNNYNQVFNNRNAWKYRTLGAFDGISLLTLASPYPHKNLSITIEVANYLKKHYPDFKFRFVLSIKKEEIASFKESLESCFVFLDKVGIEECPSLYEQCDIAFVPTLIECFTAMYAEAMRMQLPIVTTDLPFARGLCGDAAEYYQPLSPEDAAEKIYSVANNVAKRTCLINNGERQLLTFDTSEQRARKLIDYCEEICK